MNLNLIKILVLFVFIDGSFCLEAKPATCASLRKAKKACQKGIIDRVHVICGGRDYHYWLPETQYYQGSDYEPYADGAQCLLVREEVFEMPCGDFENYRVPFMFCRKKKREMCQTLKRDGFGSIALTWPKKKMRVPDSKHRIIIKDDVIKKNCEQVGL